MGRPKVYIVLVNYRGWQDTIECLASLFRQEYMNFQVVVVDNQSNDDSVANIAHWLEWQNPLIAKNDKISFVYEKKSLISNISYKIYHEKDFSDETVGNEIVSVILAEKNNGFAAGNNIAIKAFREKGDASYVWFLNNDTAVCSDTLGKIIDRATHYKNTGRKVGLIGAKLKYYYNPTLIQTVGGRFSAWGARSKHVGEGEQDVGQYDFDLSDKIDYPVGASMFCSIDFLDDIGLMCEEYFLYHEEIDWVIRGRRKGWEVGYCWDVNIYHKEGGTIGTSFDVKKKSSLSDFYGVRSRLIVLRKFFPCHLLLFYFLIPILIANRIKNKQYDRAIFVAKMATMSFQRLMSYHYLPR